ncbi:ADP-ribose pyrophosphatase [Kitasatospora sp. GAS204A]|nr:ADP-ribose pyrophosphatase [Kitasatospora sp. GAS204B]
MTDTSASWREIERTTVFSKFGRSVDRVDFELPDGRKEEFFLKRERPAGAVLALTADQHVILARQYRPAPTACCTNSPAASSNPASRRRRPSPGNCWRRPVYQGEVHAAGPYWHDAYSNAQRFAFFATNCTKVAEPTPECTEFIDVVTLPLSEFRTTVLRRGEMTDTAAAYLALDCLRLL